MSLDKEIRVHLRKISSNWRFNYINFKKPDAEYNLVIEYTRGKIENPIIYFDYTNLEYIIKENNINAISYRL